VGRTDYTWNFSKGETNDAKVAFFSCLPGSFAKYADGTVIIRNDAYDIVFQWDPVNGLILDLISSDEEE